MDIALNRANAVYLCIIAVFVIGVWAILDLGSAILRAPRDISGNWRLVDNSGSIENTPGFTVAQSGRFVRFTPDQGPGFDVVLVKSETDDGKAMIFHGEGWTVMGIGQSAGDSLTFTFQPPANTKFAPASGSYQHQRIGQETPPSVESTPRKPPTSPSSAPPHAGL